MKRQILILLAVLLVVCAVGCGNNNAEKAVPKSFEDAESVRQYLLSQNAEYVKNGKNAGDISAKKRADTSANGQQPYAVIVTCSDSRVPAEHIFNAGIGELFVIRTAGNVIGEYELGSVEYGAEHLGTKLVVVLGHTNCGAVDAALNGGAHGNIKAITDEILSCLPEKCDAREAEQLNVENSIRKIMDSEIMQKLAKSGETTVLGAIYDIESGKVDFLN